jgi:hypothetical protein
VLLVVHIPKTAGTSLRKALVGHFPVTKYAGCFQPEQIFSLVRHRHIPGAD